MRLAAPKFGFLDSKWKRVVRCMPNDASMFPDAANRNRRLDDAVDQFDRSQLEQIGTEGKRITGALKDRDPIDLEMIPYHLRAIQALRTVLSDQSANEGTTAWNDMLDNLAKSPDVPVLTHVLNIISGSNALPRQVFTTSDQNRLFARIAQHHPELKSLINASDDANDIRRRQCRTLEQEFGF